MATGRRNLGPGYLGCLCEKLFLCLSSGPSPIHIYDKGEMSALGYPVGDAATQPLTREASKQHKETKAHPWTDDKTHKTLPVSGQYPVGNFSRL